MLMWSSGYTHGVLSSVPAPLPCDALVVAVVAVLDTVEVVEMVELVAEDLEDEEDVVVVVVVSGVVAVDVVVVEVVAVEVVAVDFVAVDFVVVDFVVDLEVDFAGLDLAVTDAAFAVVASAPTVEPRDFTVVARALATTALRRFERETLCALVGAALLAPDATARPADSAPTRHTAKHTDTTI